MKTKNLLVMPYGLGSLKSDWITDAAERDFDVVLLAYHTIEEPEILESNTVKIFHYLNYKWWMIADFFEEYPELSDQYGAYFFLDDDIGITKEQINKLFYYFNLLPVKLAQPALTKDSFFSWPALKQRKFTGYRYVTTVELMCPMMKKDALAALLPTFKLSQSGWGVDLLWSKLMVAQFGTQKIVVFDIIAVTHGKPVGQGELYHKLELPAKAEEDRIRATYALQKVKIKTIPCFANTFLGRAVTYYKLMKLH